MKVSRKTRITAAGAIFASLTAVLAIGGIASSSVATPTSPIIGFNRVPAGVIVPNAIATDSNGTSNSYHAQDALNPSVVTFNGKVFLYFRGEGTGESIGVWSADATGFDGIHWNQNPVQNPILRQDTSLEYEKNNFADPAAVVFAGQVFLYYWAFNSVGNAGISVATSSDGLHFIKKGFVTAGAVPVPVVNPTDGRLYLLVSDASTNGPLYGFKLVSSSDGTNFNMDHGQVFNPSRTPGSFDESSISTARVYREGAYFYLLYSGTPSAFPSGDYPEGFGIARSADLIHWDRYSKNPIYLRGPAGTSDEGAMWSPSLIKSSGTYYLYYEGAGSNAGAGTSASNSARDTQYGGFNATSFSQIHLATATSLDLTAWDPEASFDPRMVYKVVNVNSGLALDTATTSASIGSAVTQRAFTGGVSQLWRFTDADGLYQITNAANPSAALEIAGPSAQPLSLAKLSAIDSGDIPRNHQWQLEPVGSSGAFEIINRYAEMNLEVYGQSTNSGAQVDQYPWYGGTGQQWRIEAVAPASQTEAELSTVTNAAIRSNQSASGGSYVGGIDYANSSVTFNVTTPAAGTYAINVYYANATGSPSTHAMTINGVSAGSISYSPTPTWGQFSRTTRATVTASLAAGSNTIRFSKGLGYAELDSIQLEPARAMEAEFAQVAVANVRASTSASSGRYVGGIDNANSSVTFTTPSVLAGSYTLRIFYANATGSASTHSLMVNGQAPTNLTYPPTASWGQFSASQYVTVNVTLNAGANLIQLGKATGAAEIDKIDLGRG